jgi:hypothetical protein
MTFIILPDSIESVTSTLRDGAAGHAERVADADSRGFIAPELDDVGFLLDEQGRIL